MLKVGLTGGLASGKSFVGLELARLGCSLIQADELGHQVLEPGGAAYKSVVGEFGPTILHHDGTIDRKLLASEVFGNPDRLTRLNSLVHPPVRALEQTLLDSATAANPHAIVVLEAAILIETGSQDRFDRMVLVFCDQEQQIERAMRREGARFDDVTARLGRQMPLAEKRKFAHYVIDTSGSKEDTLKRTQQVYESLVAEERLKQ